MNPTRVWMLVAALVLSADWVSGFAVPEKEKAALKAEITSSAPQARQPVPAQIATDGMSGSLRASTSRRCASRAAGESRRTIVSPYS